MRRAIATRYRIAVGWLRDGAPLWRWMLGAALLLLASYLVPIPEAALGRTINLADRARWAGMLFQFAGLCAVVYGLNESRRLFNRTSIWAAALKWITRLRYVVVPPKAVVGSGGGQLDDIILNGSMYTRAPIGSGTLDERVTQLEAAIRTIEDHVALMAKRTETMRNEARQNEERERNERIAADQKTEQQLEQAMIGGITLEAGGIAYLFVGIALTSMPEEAARLAALLGL